MEKDIRLIEEIKKEYSTMDSLGEYVQALENLLTRYKQLEEENKELKKDNFKLKDELELNEMTYAPDEFIEVLENL